MGVFLPRRVMHVILLMGENLTSVMKTDCKVLSYSVSVIFMNCCFLIKILEIYYGRRPVSSKTGLGLERITLIQDPRTSASLGPNFFSEHIKRPCFQYPGTVEVKF